jgi:molybdopterin converting factor small subunit
MKITVRLFATFRDFLPQHAIRSGLRLDVEEDESVGAVLKALHVPDELPKIVLINGRHAAEDSLLADGDVVSVFPPLIGGLSRGNIEY